MTQQPTVQQCASIKNLELS